MISNEDDSLHVLHGALNRRFDGAKLMIDK
jgi:hypothetical protein